MTLTKYDEVMEKIKVTPEMRARILQNAAAQCKPSDQKKPARVTVLRRFAALAACLAVLLAGAVTLPRLISRPAQKEEAETMIANGMEELSSRDELSAAVGFPVKAAMSLPFFPQEIFYTSYWGDMAQTDYANGSAGACLRQSVGAEDHSGDWNEYPAQQTITAAGCTVTLKGETGSYTLAIWTDGNYSYSLSLSSGQPESVWQTIIEGVQ